ncbi:hypothetical protein HYQ44_010579 [Verticillium longisporum]|nr:hypothetical protein HYQ44_010579 [Verticillium longisporum]
MDDILTEGIKFGHTNDDGQNPGGRLKHIYLVMSDIDPNKLRLALRLGLDNERIKAVDVHSSVEGEDLIVHSASLIAGQ